MSEILLGIDTGGTYTDAVLFNRERGVLAKAKSLTTRQDLSIGIAGAVDAILAENLDKTSDIRLVSISTTLATNALVEGKGGSVGLIMIGFDASDADHAGLREALGGDPVAFIAGGHDVHGNERPLDLNALDVFLESFADKVSGFAVAAYFAVRNPAHENKVRQLLMERTGLPVTCSHELSSKLGGPKRALTTLLNARLIPVIHDLISACRRHIETTGISAPLMVVRGDGALVSANFALERPIETILSGPAASLIGAKFLLGSLNAVVSDIGGTTTDVAILEEGWPRIEPEGARVGGYTTMVEAVAMHTFGIGGDSEVSLDDTQETGLRLGPRRQVPLSLLATEFPDVVYAALARQKDMENPGQHACKFAIRAPGIDASGALLKRTEERLLERLTSEPQALDTLLKGASESGTLNKLVSKGLASIAGFTPSDAMHLLGIQENWNLKAAQEAAAVFVKSKDKFGNSIANSKEVLAERIREQLIAQSCDAILDTCAAENGIALGPAAKHLINRALNREPGFIKVDVSLDRTLVGLGASAKSYYPAIGERLSTPCEVPEHADVANAIGAVAGEVRVSRTVTVSSPDGGNSFAAMLKDGPRVFADEETAIAAAKEYLEQLVFELAETAGTQNPNVKTSIEIDAPEIEGSRHFVEARLSTVATGLPSY